MIQQIGYHSFTYKHIAQQLNIQNAAIHHYFPSKDDLAVAVIEKDKGDFAAMMICMEAANPAEKIEAILNNYITYYNQGHKLCIMSTFGAVYNNIPERIQKPIKQHMDIIKEWMTGVFKEGLDTGVFHFEGSVDDMVMNWFVSLPGSLHLGRLAGDNYFQGVIEQLRRSLKMS